jgi:hypothetical protein
MSHFLIRLIDPKPLQELSSTIHQNQLQHSQHSLAQGTPRTPLQLFVESARKSIVDPVLTSLGLSYDPPPPSPPPPLDPEQAKKEREREKIRELKRRVITGGGSSLTVRLRKNGVHVRQDLPDESAEVDVGASAKPLPALKDVTRSRSMSVRTTSDGPLVPPMPMTGDQSEWASMPPPPIPLSRRSRKSSLRAAEGSPDPDLDTSHRPAKRLRTTSVKPEPEPPPTFLSSLTKKQTKRQKPKDVAEEETSIDGVGEVTDMSKGLTEAVDKNGRPRSETFKMAWSVEEQHLLETLLEQYPDGVKNRYVFD